MIKAVLFDFDGVVVQSEPMHLLSFRELLLPLGIKISKERWYKEFTGIGSTAIMARLFEDYSVKKDVKIWVEKRKRLYQKYIMEGKIKSVPGVRGFLQKLKMQKIKTAIVSGGHGTNIRLVLERLKLTQFFEVIIGLEDVQQRKPHPEGFLLAAQRLGVKPTECIAIEDSPNGMAAAHAAKMQVVCVSSPAKIDRGKCKFVIKDFSKFPKELEFG